MNVRQIVLYPSKPRVDFDSIFRVEWRKGWLDFYMMAS